MKDPEKRGIARMRGSTAMQRGQAGFSMLEVMVAMTVLTIGLLALAGMQDIALKNNIDGNSVGVATSLASDMMDRILFNYPFVTSYNNIDTQNGGTAPVQAEANGDYVQWQARLNQSPLPNARGYVQVVPVQPSTLNQNQVNVQITWGATNLLTKTVIMTASVGNQ